MTTPPSTATPRTDNAWRRYNCAELREPLELIKEMNALETELAAAKAECERLKAMGSWAHTCIHHNDEQRAKAKSCSVCASAELARLRAEIATCKDASEALVYSFRTENDQLIDENVKLAARAEKAEAELTDWSLLNAWGGTPEIIHEFIKGQQHRIHYCQNLETELESLRAEVERLRSDRDCEKRLRKDADEFRENAIARAERAEAELHDVSLDLSTANHMIKLERDRADALQTRLKEIESALRKFNLID
jgi:hypothetical protein